MTGVTNTSATITVGEAYDQEFGLNQDREIDSDGDGAADVLVVVEDINGSRAAVRVYALEEGDVDDDDDDEAIPGPGGGLAVLALLAGAVLAFAMLRGRRMGSGGR
jgi:hypothetical protein